MKLTKIRMLSANTVLSFSLIGARTMVLLWASDNFSFKNNFSVFTWAVCDVFLINPYNKHNTQSHTWNVKVNFFFPFFVLRVDIVRYLSETMNHRYISICSVYRCIFVWIRTLGGYINFTFFSFVFRHFLSVG